jgi:hypothetical protein
MNFINVPKTTPDKSSILENDISLTSSTINILDWDEIISPKLLQQILGDINNNLIEIKDNSSKQHKNDNDIINNRITVLEEKMDTIISLLKSQKTLDKPLDKHLDKPLDIKTTKEDEKEKEKAVPIKTDIMSEPLSANIYTPNLFSQNPIYPSFFKTYLPIVNAMSKNEQNIEDEDKAYIEYNRLRNKLIRKHHKCSFIPDIKHK